MLGWILIGFLTAASGVARGAESADEKPRVSIAYVDDERSGPFEHDAIVFTLLRTGDVLDALDVTVAVYDGGDMVVDAGEGRQTVMFEAGAATLSFAPAIQDDTNDEPHSTVAVALVSGTGYWIGDTRSASVQVRDDDGALIELTVDPLDVAVNEGETAMFNLVAKTVDYGTFESLEDFVRIFGKDGFSTTWSTEAVGEAAAPLDYMVLSEVVTLEYGDFEEEDGRFVLREALPGIPVFTDDEVEGFERFIVNLEQTPGWDSRIRFGTRRDIAGFPHTLARPHLFSGVVMVRGVTDALRLVDGEVAHEGRLEIFHDGEWGTICDDYWTDVDSGVACRQLGYPGAESKTGRFLRAHFGQGSGPIWLDNLSCEGSELRLIDCPRVGEGVEIGGHNCRHSEDVGIRCLEADPAASSQSLNDGAPTVTHA